MTREKRTAFVQQRERQLQFKIAFSLATVAIFKRILAKNVLSRRIGQELAF